ncbi:hypothetical protein Poli38472_006915 [Pythium oligandrum]|uniref:Uncharacterized protein n=1 Tax=Pythium oligandrum TaxID=41045 RepID=A0A8K1FCW0_PYTOL|nr:hypothetical protein Poli38472_006915 [Pythium oligandrum]|eukprot:TMW58770.1 hypothetical protein Poli38472_006915 [Pythium oligandrum]
MDEKRAPTSPDDLCQYPNKFCSNHRVYKSNGKLHRFCELHRAQANENQKRWLRRRVTSKDAKEEQPPAATNRSSSLRRARTARGSAPIKRIKRKAASDAMGMTSLLLEPLNLYSDGHHEQQGKTEDEQKQLEEDLYWLQEMFQGTHEAAAHAAHALGSLSYPYPSQVYFEYTDQCRIEAGLW